MNSSGGELSRDPAAGKKTMGRAKILKRWPNRNSAVFRRYT